MLIKTYFKELRNGEGERSRTCELVVPLSRSDRRETSLSDSKRMKERRTGVEGGKERRREAEKKRRKEVSTSFYLGEPSQFE